MKEKHKKGYILLLLGLLLIPNHAFAFEKKETVYTNLHADGSVSKINVTNHLSQLSDDKINDETRLKEILNINGKETFTLKDGNLIWNTKGEDIFYKGKSKSELPIQVNISYFLDDNQMDVEDMIGKKGNVKIIYSFTNLEKHKTYINGEEKDLYTPFMVTLGTMFENNKNKNISITNGKIVNTGTKSMAIAVASPGLYESTSLNTFKTMNNIEITYETKSFKLGNVYLVATPKLLEKNDLMVFDKMDSLSKKVDTLQSSMNQIEAGIKNLADGTSKLYNGAETLKQNLAKADSAVKQLQAGSISLDNGLKQIILALQDVQNTMNNQNIPGSLQNLTTLKNENEKAIHNILGKTGQTFENLTSLYITNNLKDYTGSDASLLSIKSSYEMIYLLTQNNTAIENTISSISSLNEQIHILLSTLNNSLYKLENGAATLSNGLIQLQNGIYQLYNGSESLLSGIEGLYNGTNSLMSGTNTFNKEGIGSLTHLSNEAKKYNILAKKLSELSVGYKGFSSNNSKTTLFVYMVESTK